MFNADETANERHDEPSIPAGVPYTAIDKAIADGKVIPFLGAGASMERRPPKVQWSFESNEQFGPLSRELAEWLALRVAFPDDEELLDLARVAQFADSTIGREILSDNLRDVFKVDRPFGRIHEYLASFDNPLLIITTNYDDAIEAALDAVGRPYNLLVHTLGDRHSAAPLRLRRAGCPAIESVAEVALDLSATTTVFKMHGSCRPDEFEDYLISEDDYLRFLSRMIQGTVFPLNFAEALKSRRFLFIGYGFGDWNLRLLLHQLHGDGYLQKPTESLKSWAISYEVGEVDKQLWRDRDVIIYNALLSGVVDGLEFARVTRLGAGA